MNGEYLNELIELGYADEAAVVADVTYAGGAGALCVNGEVVSLVTGDPPVKVFSDSIDKLDGLTVKTGLFKKTVAFIHCGAEYVFVVKNGKNLLEYFKLLG